MRKQTKRGSKEWLNCECPVCGTKFHAKKCYLERVKTDPCCCIECANKKRKVTMSGENNHQFGLKGQKNASWKSDKRISRYGYVQIRCLDHPFKDQDGFVFEHRLVAEKHLLTKENSVIVDGKMYLSKEYVVHHVDMNKKNNAVENLKVMTKAEHQSYHAKMHKNKRNNVTGRFERDE